MVHSPVLAIDVNLNETAVRAQLAHFQLAIKGPTISNIDGIAPRQIVLGTGAKQQLIEFGNRSFTKQIVLKTRLAVAALEADANAFLGSGERPPPKCSSTAFIWHSLEPFGVMNSIEMGTS